MSLNKRVTSMGYYIGIDQIRESQSWIYYNDMEDN